ncbi:MAG TPA: sulfotransferase [Gaiellales bacterium]|nr:sulfotransferase [Gaiellales bacterium]
MRNPDVTILYILGSGRSGSTVLERSLVDAVAGSVGVGELRWFWDRGMLENYLCGCGSPFDACGFWQEVVERLKSRRPPVAADKMIGSRRRVERLRHTPFLLMQHRAPAAYGRELAAYREGLEALYRSVAAVAGARIVVDSSKEPGYAFVLAGLRDVRLHVLHLVRDSRAVAYSWQKRVGRPEIHWAKQDMRRYTAWQSATQWNRKNALAELLRSRGVPVTRLRYEDFAGSPAASLRRLTVDIGAPARTSPVAGPWHSVSGNPVRFRDDARSVTLDSEWERCLPRGKRFVVTAATAPLLIRYGYPLSVRP